MNADDKRIALIFELCELDDIPSYDRRKYEIHRIDEIKKEIDEIDRGIYDLKNAKKKMNNIKNKNCIYSWWIRNKS